MPVIANTTFRKIVVIFLKVAWRNVPTEGRREQETKSGSSHRSES
jgi:hypothetical protein